MFGSTATLRRGAKPLSGRRSFGGAQVRVVIITEKGLMHKFLCVQIADKHNVTAILHPSGPHQYATDRIGSLRSNLRKHGAAALVLRKLSDVPFLRLGWNREESLRRAQRRFFSDADAAYDRRVAHLARDVEDINSPEAVRLLSGLRADVVICLGGPVYRAPLIKATSLALNYHTGISPIYNGAGTIFWTFANKHVHLAGGTLMVMNEVVDGGHILAHYLCPIEADDDPGTLFMKAIVGGAKLYDRFLQHLSRGGQYVRIPQTRPFFYYRGFEWTICQTLSVQRNIDRGLCRRFERSEDVIEYWRLETEETAQRALKDNVAKWVGDV